MSDAWRWVTDGGLETDLIFHHGVDLPEFAAYPLVWTDEGRALLRTYYDGYADIAAAVGAGLLVATRAGRIAPVSREMILNFVAMHSLGLPKSY